MAACTTIAFGFAQYFSGFLPVSPQLAAVSVVLLLGFVNYFGMRAVYLFNDFAIFLKVGGLIALVVLFFAAAGFGGFHFAFDSPKGTAGIVSASVLLFFAYMGFQVLANVAEEVKDVRRNLPRAILISIGMTALIYILIAFAFTSVLSYEKIVGTVESGKGALAVAAGEIGGPAFLLALGIIAIFSTADTIMICLMGGSRIIYGMAEDKALPRQLLHTTSSGAPGLAILVTIIPIIPLIFMGDISLLARVSVSGMFILFIFDNLSVIALRLKQPGLARPFRIPFSIANVPMLPLIAALATVGLLAYELYYHPLMLEGFVGLALVGLVLNEAEYRLTGD
ncbi:Amino acid permease [Candidatus Burarchaeum australiense]|nr:Amino acid permease [Candidatus Burarchaeum australiense]